MSKESDSEKHASHENCTRRPGVPPSLQPCPKRWTCALPLATFPKGTIPNQWFRFAIWAVPGSFAITQRILFSLFLCLIICLNSAGLSVNHHDSYVVFANACVAHCMHVNNVAYVAVRRDVQMQHAFTPACYNYNADNVCKQIAPMEKTCSQESPGSMSYIQQPISSRDSACHFALRNSLHPSSMSELRHPHLKID